MTTPDRSSQQLESYVPVYDVFPEKWEDGSKTLVEHLKKMSNAINSREIGYLLDEELLSGKSFYPGVNSSEEQTAEQFRSILRKVIPFGAIVVGANARPHGINAGANFTLIQLWASATNSTTFRSVTFGDVASISMDATNINIISDGVYDRCNAVLEYIQEV